MAVTIITFKAITSDRRIVNRNIPIEHDFVEIPAQKWHGIDLPPTTVEEQVMNQLDETDKTNIMLDNDFDLIIDYWPKKPRKRKKKDDELKEFMRYCQPLIDENPSFKRPFEAIISESKDTLFGKGKSNEAKLKEVMKMYDLVMKGASGVTKMVMGILAKYDDESKKLLENK